MNGSSPIPERDVVLWAARLYVQFQRHDVELPAGAQFRWNHDPLCVWTSRALGKQNEARIIETAEPISKSTLERIVRDLIAIERLAVDGCKAGITIAVAIVSALAGFAFPPIWIVTIIAVVGIIDGRNARQPAPNGDMIVWNIARWIAFEQRQRTFWLSLSPREFEIETAKLLERDGFSTKVTQFSQDGGIDIIATRDNEKLAVQCKHYQTSKVAPKEIRALAGSMQIEGATTGLMVCSGGFTKGAVTEAATLKIALWDMEEVLLRASRKT